MGRSLPINSRSLALILLCAAGLACDEPVEPPDQCEPVLDTSVSPWACEIGSRGCVCGEGETCAIGLECDPDGFCMPEVEEANPSTCDLGDLGCYCDAGACHDGTACRAGFCRCP